MPISLFASLTLTSKPQQLGFINLVELQTKYFKPMKDKNFPKNGRHCTIQKQVSNTWMKFSCIF